MNESVCIKTCGTEQEAEIVRAILEDSGIHAMVSTDDYIGLPLTISDGVRVFVSEENEAKAKEILANAEGD